MSKIFNLEDAFTLGQELMLEAYEDPPITDPAILCLMDLARTLKHDMGMELHDLYILTNPDRWEALRAILGVDPRKVYAHPLIPTDNLSLSPFVPVFPDPIEQLMWVGGVP